jgi:hypothetical protein
MLAAQVGARRGSTRVFLVWLGCVGGIATYRSCWALRELMRHAWRARSDTRSRLVGIVLVGMSVLTAVMWLGQDVLVLMSGLVPSDVLEAGLLTNPTHVLDLGLVLPACVVAGFLLPRRRVWGFVPGPYFLVNLQRARSSAFSSFWLGEHVTDAPKSITPQLNWASKLSRLGDGVDIGLEELFTAPAGPVNESGLPQDAACFGRAVVLIGYRRASARKMRSA